MNRMDYVRILRDLREDADKTQTQIAEVLGTSQTMYARYERGANELPIHHLITLSKYYGVSTDYLLGRTDTPDIPLRLSASERRLILDLRTLNPDQKAVAAQNIQFMASQNRR